MPWRVGMCICVFACLYICVVCKFMLCSVYIKVYVHQCVCVCDIVCPLRFLNIWINDFIFSHAHKHAYTLAGSFMHIYIRSHLQLLQCGRFLLLAMFVCMCVGTRRMFLLQFWYNSIFLHFICVCAFFISQFLFFVSLDMGNVYGYVFACVCVCVALLNISIWEIQLKLFT